MVKNNLKHVLVDHDMSLAELARRIGIAYSIINDFANMKRSSVQFDVLEKICRELGVTIGDVLIIVPDEDKRD
jgi:DNA-binding Xre family transcriptional regulator